ncbi:MAG: hypothetical protein GF320_17965, partial [Armatimonadia bacterium]|nr:hypothetical protein [Armatimonadia bacterium]
MDKYLVLAIVLFLVTLGCAIPVGWCWYRMPRPPKADPGVLGLGTEETARKFALYHAKRGTTLGGPWDEVEIHSISCNKHGWWIVRGERLRHNDDGTMELHGIRLSFYCDPASRLYIGMGCTIYPPGDEPP